MSIRPLVLTFVIMSAIGVVGCVDANEDQMEAIVGHSNFLETHMENVAGGSGWQGKFTYTPPTGLGSLFFHYGCPAAFPVAQNGGFWGNAVAQTGMAILSNAPRLDLTPAVYSEWAWTFRWSGGAQAGAAINFDVYCVAGPP